MSTTQALERVRPQERALVQAASDLGILRESGGALMIDLSSAQLAERFNVLAPAATLVQADPNFTPAISVVNLNPDPQGGDFYEIEKPKAASGDYAAKPGAYALSKRALDVIGKQAGIEDLDPVIVYFGDHDQNVRVTWRSRVRRPDGTFQTLSGTREWIEEDEAALLKSNPPAWAQKGESAFNKWWAENWYGRVKKFRIPMTETKARLRAYRQALTLKSKYTLAELSKPFLVASTTFTPDTSNPEILRMVFTGGEQATNLLYGPPAVAPPSEEPADAIDGHCEEAPEQRELPPAGVDPETGEMFPAKQPEGHGPRPTEDLTVPQGTYAGKPISEAIRDDREWGTTMAASKSTTWGPIAEAWLKYWYGEEGEDAIPF